MRLRLALGLSTRLLRRTAAVKLDVCDAQHGQFLPVSLLRAVARLGPVLEDDQFLAPILTNDLRGDRRLGHDRGTDMRRFSVGDQQDAIESDRIARVARQALDRKLSAKFDAVLLATRFDYCVHAFSTRRALHACCIS